MWNVSTHNQSKILYYILLIIYLVIINIDLLTQLLDTLDVNPAQQTHNKKNQQKENGRNTFEYWTTSCLLEARYIYTH